MSSGLLALAARGLLVLYIVLALLPRGRVATRVVVPQVGQLVKASVSAHHSWPLTFALHPEAEHGQTHFTHSKLHTPGHDVAPPYVPRTPVDLAAVHLHRSRAARTIHVVPHERFFSPPRAPTA